MKWKYLYRAVDSEGKTLDFMLNAKRDKKATKRFFKKVLKSKHNKQQGVINVDKNAAYPLALEELKEDKVLFVIPTPRNAIIVFSQLL